MSGRKFRKDNGRVVHRVRRVQDMEFRRLLHCKCGATEDDRWAVYLPEDDPTPMCSAHREGKPRLWMIEKAYPMDSLMVRVPSGQEVPLTMTEGEPTHFAPIFDSREAAALVSALEAAP